MSIFNMVGCGGSSLNYEVVDGTSAPSSPSENTIWINTSTTITSHIFSANEPENPVAGMVWITVGASSPSAFSATEENPIMIYPISAKQYVSGAWISVDMKCYQNGTWNSFYFWVIGNGANAQSLTGGFTGVSDQVVFYGDGTVKFYHAANTSEHNAYIYSKSAFDVTGYTKMTIKVTSTSGSTRYFGLNTPSNLGNKAAARVGITGTGTYELSIPDSWTKAHIQADFLYEGGTIVVSELYFS